MRLINYIKRLILSDSKESSKRFVTMYSLLLITFVVVFYTNRINSVLVLTTLCTFVLALCGVSVYETIKKKDE